MISLKIMIIALAFGSLFTTVPDNEADEATRFVINGDSKLWVEGTSSLHDFNCEAADIVGFVNANTLSLGVQEVSVTVPAGRLDCDNNRMNRLMHRALKTDAHSSIKYELKHATVESNGDAHFVLATQGLLTIAGVTREIEMNVDGEKLADGNLRFHGKHALLMSDYDVDRPTAMLGAVRTHDEVVVHFDVVVSPAGT